MSKYEEFLNEIGVISEEDFNQIINTLPVVNISSVNFGDLGEFDSYEEISRVIINYIISSNTEYGYCYDVNFEKKLIEIEDISSLEELENIKNIFNKWTISNYDEIVKELNEQEEIDKEEKEFSELLDLIRNKASIEQLRKFVDEL